MNSRLVYMSEKHEATIDAKDKSSNCSVVNSLAMLLIWKLAVGLVTIVFVFCVT